MTRKFFGTDGIRGLANTEPMTPATALRVGMTPRPGPEPSTVGRMDVRVTGESDALSR